MFHFHFVCVSILTLRLTSEIPSETKGFPQEKRCKWSNHSLVLVCFFLFSSLAVAQQSCEWLIRSSFCFILIVIFFFFLSCTTEFMTVSSIIFLWERIIKIFPAVSSFSRLTLVIFRMKILDEAPPSSPPVGNWINILALIH